MARRGPQERTADIDPVEAVQELLASGRQLRAVLEAVSLQVKDVLDHAQDFERTVIRARRAMPPPRKQSDQDTP